MNETYKFKDKIYACILKGQRKYHNCEYESWQLERSDNFKSLLEFLVLRLPSVSIIFKNMKQAIFLLWYPQSEVHWDMIYKHSMESWIIR